MSSSEPTGRVGEGAPADPVSAPPPATSESSGRPADPAQAEAESPVEPEAAAEPETSGGSAVAGAPEVATEPAAAQPVPTEPDPIEPDPTEPDPTEPDPTEPRARPEAVATAAPEQSTEPIRRTGAFEAYTIGDPGRAFSHAVSLTEVKHRDAHDIVIDAATVPDPEGTPRLILRGASSRGLAHQQYADPRQDDHCTVLSRDGEWLVCLVADGVSSGEWSHLAAKMATEEGAAQVIRMLETHEPAEIPYREIYARLADLLADVCATLPDSEPTVDLTQRDVAKRMATTLVIGIVATRPGQDGTHAVTVVRLGDTSAWIVDDERGWIALGEVKNAGNVIAESATACLPLVPEADPVPVQTTLGEGAALVLMTDGIGDPLGSGGGEVGRELARLWARPPHPLEFAAQVAFGRKTFDDDRGAIGVWLVVPE